MHSIFLHFHHKIQMPHTLSAGCVISSWIYPGWSIWQEWCLKPKIIESKQCAAEYSFLWLKQYSCLAIVCLHTWHHIQTSRGKKWRKTRYPYQISINTSLSFNLVIKEIAFIPNPVWAQFWKNKILIKMSNADLFWMASIKSQAI